MSHTLSSRPVKSEDLNYIYDTWLNSWRGSRWAGVIPNHLYFDTQRALIAGLIARGASIRVVHFESTPDLIEGWTCFEYQGGNTILHYLYSRDPYLLRSITDHFLTTVLGTSPGLVTHQQLNRSVKKWKHCPEIARRKSL